MRVERKVQVKASPEDLYEVVMNPRCLEEW